MNFDGLGGGSYTEVPVVPELRKLIAAKCAILILWLAVTLKWPLLTGFGVRACGSRTVMIGYCKFRKLPLFPGVSKNIT